MKQTCGHFLSQFTHMLCRLSVFCLLMLLLLFIFVYIYIIYVYRYRKCVLLLVHEAVKSFALQIQQGRSVRGAKVIRIVCICVQLSVCISLCIFERERVKRAHIYTHSV